MTVAVRNSVDMIFARSGMGYVGVWDRGGIEMNVDHLHRRSGELHGEIVISSAASAAGRGKLHRASFNLSSTTARERLGKSLVDRARSEKTIPWSDYLEEFCAAVLEAERGGAPIIALDKLPPAVGEQWLVEPFLPAKQTTIVYAAGGTGKSYLAVLVSVAVTAGLDVLNWRVRQGRVLYLDWETDGYEVASRVKRVAAGLGIDPPEVLYRPCATPMYDIAEAISAFVADRGITLVVVDSVGMASGTTREGGTAEESAIKLFGAFRHLGCTVLAIDHVTGEDAKRADKATVKPYGSIYKVNLARSVWELKGIIEDEGTDSHMALHHRKVNSGRLLPSVGIRVRHEQDSVEFAREEISDAGLVSGLSNSVRIQRALRGGSMTVGDLAEETGLSDGVVRVTLHRGKATIFTKLPDGTWGLISREES